VPLPLLIIRKLQFETLSLLALVLDISVNGFWKMRPWSFKLSSVKLDHSMMISEM